MTTPLHPIRRGLEIGRFVAFFWSALACQRFICLRLAAGSWLKANKGVLRNLKIRKVEGNRGGSDLRRESLKKIEIDQSAQGFSLMEVLVGITIVGIVYATLFSLMTTSLKNIGRIDEREKLTRLGQMKLNELVLSVNLGKIPAVLTGKFDEKYSWKSRIEPVRLGDTPDNTRDYVLAMIRLTVFWPGGSHQQNEYSLETFTSFSKKP